METLILQMKVVQINTVYGAGSTGRTTKELHEALKRDGIDSFVIFGVGNKDIDPHIFRSQTKFGYMVNNVFSRLFGLEGFLAFCSTLRIITHLKKIKPDVIHLRNLHGHYINIPLLFRFLRRTECKIVMSLHDLWMFTGSCPSPYLYNCEKWKEKCFSCPAKHEYPSSLFFDFSKIKHNYKRRSILSIKDRLTIVGVSQWTMKMAKLANMPLSVTYIYNWIDLENFSPKEQTSISSQIELVCVSSMWEKDSDKLNNLIYIANSLPPKYHITMVGYCNFGKKDFLPRNITSVPSKNVRELAYIYSQSDLFLHLSHSDTFGKVIAESLACGTPVIAFDITAMSEMIVTGCGSKISPFDLNQFVDKIKTYGKKDKTTIKKCRESSVRRFSYRNIYDTIALYKILVQNI